MFYNIQTVKKVFIKACLVMHLYNTEDTSCTLIIIGEMPTTLNCLSQTNIHPSTKEDQRKKVFNWKGQDIIPASKFYFKSYMSRPALSDILRSVTQNSKNKISITAIKVKHRKWHTNSIFFQRVLQWLRPNPVSILYSVSNRYIFFFFFCCNMKYFEFFF